MVRVIEGVRILKAIKTHIQHTVIQATSIPISQIIKRARRKHLYEKYINNVPPKEELCQNIQQALQVWIA